MTAFPLSDRFVAELKVEFPGFDIRHKDRSRLSWLIDKALKIITLGAQSQYLTHYHTVLGNTLYVPASWASLGDIDRVILLRHERIHLLQRKRYGSLLMAILYLLPFLPLGLAYGRAKMEWEAYTETLRATADYYGLEAAQAAPMRQKIISRFTGGAYGWMWPFPKAVGRWYDEAIGQIAAERAGRS